MSELGEQIEALNDTQAIQAAGYVAECLRQQVEKDWATKVSLDDNAAASKLSGIFPEAAGALGKLHIGGDPVLRAEVARQFLAVCEEDAEYAGYVQDALDQLAFKFEPLTIMAVTAGIVFLMQLRFKAKVKLDTPTVKGEFEIGKDPTSEGLLNKIMGLGKGTVPVK